MNVSEQFNSIIVTNNNNIKYNQYNNEFSAPLLCYGGIAMLGGCRIGFQSTMESGLVFYDDENFYGFSKKYGIIPLSTINKYYEIDIKKIIPSIEFDIILKDIANIYINIPIEYNDVLFGLELLFNIIVKFNFITHFYITIKNTTSKQILFNFVKNQQNNIYKSSTCIDIIEPNTIIELSGKIINNVHDILINSTIYNL